MHKNNILIQSSCEATASIKKVRRGRQLLIGWWLGLNDVNNCILKQTKQIKQTNTDEPQSNVLFLSMKTSCCTFQLQGISSRKITTSVHYTNIKTSVYKCASLTETDVQFCSALGRWSLTCFRTCSQSVQVELSTVDLLAPTQSHGFTTEALRAAAFGHSRAALSVSVWRLSHRMIHVPLSLSANTWREEPAVSRKNSHKKYCRWR